MNLGKAKLLFNKESWKRIFKEIASFFKKMRLTVRILSPNERRIIVILLIIVLVSAVILFRNYYIRLTTTTPQVGGVYREGIIGSPKYLNPVLAKSEIDRDICRLLFASLLKYNENGVLSPYLAKEYSISEDQKHYFFKLDERILWHDKEKITSEDVRFTINLLQQPDYAGPYNTAFDGIQFRKINEFEFELILPETNSSFIQTITLVGILPKHKLENVSAKSLDKNEFNLNPIGSGRYKLDLKETDLVSDQIIVLRKADTFGADENGYIEEIDIVAYQNQGELFEAYKKGEISGFGGFSLAELSDFDRKKFKIYKVFIPRFSALFFNLENQHLSELKFRQAFAHMIDRETISDEVYDNEVEILNSPFASFVLGYNPDVKKYTHHPPTSESYLNDLNYFEKSKEGIKQKDGQELNLVLYTIDDLKLQRVAELIRQDAEKIGIRITVVVVDLTILQTEIIPAQAYDMILIGGSLGLPPDPYSYFHSTAMNGGLNISRYKNLKADKLLEEARLKSSLDEKGESLRQFANIAANDLPALFFFNTPYLYGANKTVKGIPKRVTAESSSDRFLFINSWYMKSERVKE